MPEKQCGIRQLAKTERGSDQGAGPEGGAALQVGFSTPRKTGL